MDKSSPQAQMLARRLSDYACALSYDDVSTKVIWEAKRRTLDTLGCAIAAFDAEPVRIARKLALDAPAQKGATILGTNKKTPADMAAFINGVMFRYLDFNDSYHAVGAYLSSSKGGAHPSDNIAACLAVSDFLHGNGKEFLLSIILAYEIHCGFCNTVDYEQRGWQPNGCNVLISGALAAAKLLKLSPQVATEAVNISLSSHIALGARGASGLSMWKGCNGAEPARNAVFSAMLAAGGMTGPSPIFEDEYGYFDQITGPLEMDTASFGKKDEFEITQVAFKLFPANGELQSVLLATTRAHSKIASIADISKIEIDTIEHAYQRTVSAPGRWSPKTRETADHSMPFTVAVILLDGALTSASFDESKLTDPKIAEIIKKIAITESSALASKYPDSTPSLMRVYLKSGDVITEEVGYSRGHRENPATDAELEHKFRQNAQGYLSESQIDKIISMVWELDELQNVTDLVEACAIPNS